MLSADFRPDICPVAITHAVVATNMIQWYMSNHWLQTFYMYTSLALYMKPVLAADYMSYTPFTDRKENQIFLIYKKIQGGAVAKSYMTNGLLIYGEIFAHFLIY